MDEYHLVYEKETWKLKKANATRAMKNFETKKEGVKYSTDHVKVKGGSLKIHKLDGAIQEERTYPRSADPVATKG